LSVVLILLFYFNCSFKNYFVDDAVSTFATSFASLIATLSFIGYFLNKYLSQKDSKESIRHLLAQELLENLKRSFYAGVELPFQTFGFHKLKKNASDIKDFHAFYLLSTLYIEFDYCMSYPREHKADKENLNQIRFETGRKIIEYLKDNLENKSNIMPLLHTLNKFDTIETKNMPENISKYRNNLFDLTQAIEIDNLFTNLKTTLLKIL
jgi:hypothetical protein